MIDYRILVQAIADWRAGQRPGGREYAETAAGGRGSHPVDGHGQEGVYPVESVRGDEDEAHYDESDIPLDEEIDMSEEGEEVQHG